MELVLVYLGSEIPKYVRENLILLKRQFPDYDCVLLTDSVFLFNKLATEMAGINVELVSNPEETWNQVLGASGFSREFRDNFWGKTLARFFSIHEYMSKNPNNSVLHIEADVWLSPNFPLEKFESINHLIAYPLTNADQGVASTIFFKNSNGAKLLKSYAAESMSIDNQSTDVSVLGNLYLKYPDDILILPTSPSQEFTFHNHVGMETKIAMSKYFPDFGGVFDASTWGQFITGEDPRNSVGKKLLYHHQLHHAVCPIDLRFSFKGTRSLIAKNNTFEFEIFSLHIHSKTNKIFNYLTSGEQISRYSKNYQGKQSFEFYFWIFARSIFPFLKYKLRITLKKLLR